MDFDRRSDRPIVLRAVRCETIARIILWIAIDPSYREGTNLCMICRLIHQPRTKSVATLYDNAQRSEVCDIGSRESLRPANYCYKKLSDPKTASASMPRRTARFFMVQTIAYQIES
jgi:hypothetical protein